MKSIIAVLAMALMLGGCAGNYGITEKFTETNQLISDSNNGRLAAFAEGMAACGDNAACQVGVSMAFAGNMGQQQLFKPETAKDYLMAFMPYATLGVDVFRMWSGGGGSGQGIVVNGKGNTVIGVGNKSTADNGASVAANTSPSIYTTNSTVTQDRTEQGGPVSVTGTAPAQVVQPEVIMVEPFILPEVVPVP